MNRAFEPFKNEEKLNGTKIKKMGNDKQFYISLGIDEKKSIKFSQNIFWFRNMINSFEDIIPKKISVKYLKSVLFCLIYQNYEQKYETNWIFFKMISNQSLRPFLREIDLKFSKKNSIKELYDILLFYNGEINFENEEIIIPNKLSISLKNIDIEKIKKELKSDIIQNFSITIEIKKNFYKNFITYYYPKEFYEEKNLLQIFWFFNFFIRDFIEDNELTKIIPPELNDFNEVIDSYLRENINNVENNIWNHKFKQIIKLGYKLLEGIGKVNKDDIQFSNGIDLFNNKNEEESINFALEKIDYIRNYFNKIMNRENMWVDIKEKIKILEQKKEIYEYLNFKNEYDKRLDNIKKEINKNKEFEFLDNYRIIIHNLIENKEKKEIIEDKFKE